MKNYISEIKKIQSRIFNGRITIGVVGLGYVGLPLALLFAKKKFKIYGFDNDNLRLNLLKKNKPSVDVIVNELSLA